MHLMDRDLILFAIAGLLIVLAALGINALDKGDNNDGVEQETEEWDL